MLASKIFLQTQKNTSTLKSKEVSENRTLVEYHLCWILLAYISIYLQQYSPPGGEKLPHMKIFKCQRCIYNRTKYIINKHGHRKFLFPLNV